MKKIFLFFFGVILFVSCDVSVLPNVHYLMHNCTDDIVYLECVSPENDLLVSTILPDSLGLPCGKYFDNKGEIFKYLKGEYTPRVYMLYKSNWYCVTEKDSLSWLFPMNYDTTEEVIVGENGEMYKEFIYNLTDDYISTLTPIER